MRGLQPPSSGPSAGSRKVEPRHQSPSDQRRKQARAAATAARIQTTARERQHAWAETGQPNRTYQLTRELDGLYDEHRDDQAGTLTDPYFGRTMKAGS